MCVSAAVLKQVSNSKIVHESVTKSCQCGAGSGKGRPRAWVDLVPAPTPANQGLLVISLPPVEVDPNKAFEDGEI